MINSFFIKKLLTGNFESPSVRWATFAPLAWDAVLSFVVMVNSARSTGGYIHVFVGMLLSHGPFSPIISSVLSHQISLASNRSKWPLKTFLTWFGSLKKIKTVKSNTIIWLQRTILMILTVCIKVYIGLITPLGY